LALDALVILVDDGAQVRPPSVDFGPGARAVGGHGVARYRMEVRTGRPTMPPSPPSTSCHIGFEEPERAVVTGCRRCRFRAWWGPERCDELDGVEVPVRSAQRLEAGV